jgi:hypothetical protein
MISLNEFRRSNNAAGVHAEALLESEPAWKTLQLLAPWPGATSAAYGGDKKRVLTGDAEATARGLEFHHLVLKKENHLLLPVLPQFEEVHELRVEHQRVHYVHSTQTWTP